jgi:hypothetical protein
VAPAMAAFGVACMSWLGLYGFAWNDYESEAQPAMQALLHGHFAQFAQLAPAYGGSLLLRAPFAFLVSLWGGGSLAVYRAVSIPCLIAAGLLGLLLCAQMRRAGDTRLARALALGLCVANPITLRAIELGHAEELLGASLCVTAVLLAASCPAAEHGRPALQPRAILAGVLVGLAIANKEWALIALGPVLLTLRAGRLQTLAAAALAAAALMAPIALLASSFVNATGGSASSASTIFQPWQAFWFLGRHGALVRGLFGTPKPGYRIGPSFAGPVSHPLIIFCGAALPLALWWQRRSPAVQAPAERESRLPIGLPDALLLLSLLMLLRCMLDTWDNVYYTLPLLLSILAWEVNVFRRPPAIALCVTVLCWVSFQWLPTVASPDVQAAFFLCWTAPLAAAMALRLYLPGARLPRSARIATSTAAKAPLA